MRLPPKKTLPAKKPGVATSFVGLKPSKTIVPFDIPIARLVEHKENPNEQSEKTFDQIVERIRSEGFDDPIKVAPQMIKGKPTGKFLIIGGHHRVKAAKTLGMTSVPAIIREGWDQDRIDIELLADNSLSGKLNPHKFTEMWDRLKKRYDPEQLKQMVGLTEKKAFAQLYKRVMDQLPERQKKKLAEAKEKINSIEDLSSVLNEIFTEHGSETDHSMMILSYGGKKHTYVQISKNTQSRLESIKERLAGGENVSNFFEKLLSDGPTVDNLISSIVQTGKPKTNAKRSLKITKKA